MLKELNKKPLRSAIGWGIVLLLIGGILLMAMLPDISAELSGPADISRYDVADLEDKYVEAEVNFIWEPFCYVGDSEEDAEEIQYIVAVTPLDNMDDFITVDYIAVSVKGGLMDDMADLYKRGNVAFSTWNAADLGKSVKLRGVVDNMDSDEIDFYNEILAETEMTDANVHHLILRAGTTPGGNSFSVWFMTLIAAALIAFAVFRIVKAFRGGYQKDIRAYCEATGNPDGAMEALDSFYQVTQPLPGGIRANNRWVLFTEGLNARILDAASVRWVYTSAVRHRTNGIPTGTTYSLVLAQDGGKRYNVTMKNEQQAREAAAGLFPLLTGAVFGYGEQFETMIKQQPDAMAQMAANQHARTEENAVN